MSGSEEEGRVIRKIAVAFDPVCGAPGLLETAAEFAALFGAELEALFVDDPDMTRLSQLPFGGTIALASGKAEPFDALALVQGRAGPAARIRATLRSLAQLHRFAYSVRELHGRALTEATGESTAELLVVASFHGKFGGTRHVDEEAIGFAAASLRSVLLISQYPVSARRTVLVTDDSEIGHRAAAIAGRMSPPDPVGAGLQLRWPGEAASDPDAVAAEIRSLSPTLVVIGLADSGRAAALRERLQGDGLSLLIVR